MDFDSKLEKSYGKKSCDVWWKILLIPICDYSLYFLQNETIEWKSSTSGDSIILPPAEGAV